MQLYEAREFSHDGKVYPFTFYAKDDYTAISTVKIHPFRMNKHEVYKVVNGEPVLLAVSESMDPTSLADGFFITHPERPIEEKTDLAQALMTYYAIPIKYRIKLMEKYYQMIPVAGDIIESLFDEGETFKQFDGSNVTGSARRRIYGKIIGEGGWHGYRGITS